jgi:hypothetical protein
LAPTVGIAATGFCYPGGILQIFSSSRSANFAAADSSSQIASSHRVYIGEFLHQQQDRRWLVVPHQAIIIISRLISVKAEVDEFDCNSTDSAA